MDGSLSKTQWAIAAMATMISFCASYFLFNAIDAPRAETAAPVIVSEPAATTVQTTPPKTTPLPTTASAPKATTAPAKTDKKADCGDGVCVAPENPDRCPADCPVR